MSEIALSNTINITLQGVPTGLTNPSVNSIGLFTIERPSNSDEYRQYLSSTEVGKDYGTSSVTYQMAEAIFAQTPNLRTGDGALYIVPYVATSATSATAVTTNIVGNIANFTSVSDGALKITIDGVVTEISGLDFTSVTTMADIATVLNNANMDIFIGATQTGTTNGTITFTSKRVGATESSIAFGTATNGTDIAGANFLNTSAATITAGTAATAQETFPEAVTRVYEKFFCGGVLTSQVLENANIETYATTIQTLDRLWMEGTCSLNNISVLGTAITAASDKHTHIMAYSLGQTAMKCAISAYLSKALSVNWNGSNTANTMNLKQLSTILPDTNLTQTYFANATTNNVDLYGSTQGRATAYSNGVGLMYVDEVIMDLFLKTRLEIAGFNALAQTNTKVAQTETGMNVLRNAYEQVLIQGVRNNYIAPGTWNSSEKFGDPEDFVRNISERGYYMYNIPITEQAQTEREERKAPVLQIAVKRAGAFHSSDVIVTLER